jgi:gamma-glutamyltranspeptidase/glutathione hydrolase
VVNVIDHEMSLEDAVAARRWFIADNELRIEATGLPSHSQEALEALGYALSLYDGMDGYFARVHAVLLDPSSGVLWGASDPRDFGAAGGR